MIQQQGSTTRFNDRIQQQDSTAGFNMFSLKTDIIGLAPFIGVMGYLWGRTTWGTSRYGGYPFLLSMGLSIIIFTITFFALFISRKHLITRILFSVLGIFLLGVGILFSIVGEFKGMYILIFSSWYEGVYGTWACVDIFRDLGMPRRRESKMIVKFKKPVKFQSIGLVLVACMIPAGIISTQAWTFDGRVELQFSISGDDMQEKELVLYWVRQNLTDPAGFVDVLHDTNTVLALQGNPDLFQEIGSYTTLGADAANLVDLCNDAGVKVEVWPVPSSNLSCALSLRYVDCMPTVYGYFKDWVAKYNISVDYYSFDIEDYVALPPFENSTVGRHVATRSPLYWTFNGIYNMAAKQEFLRTNRSNWNALVRQQQDLIDEIIDDGYIPRGTIQPQAWDALDGDLNSFKKDFMQSYEIKGYEYLSGMYYRSCEWGNNDSSYLVYKNVRIMHAVSPYEKTAVCIGCIGYPSYVTAQDVANDVWLSIGAGADSVRLFLGDSWVYSFSPNETAGLQNLRTMLELCRAGGTGVTSYHPSWDLDIFKTVFADVFEDL
ncbi:MAG: hypothetical protein ACTSU9_01900 [Promethearchaeota archaeon]